VVLDAAGAVLDAAGVDGRRHSSGAARVSATSSGRILIEKPPMDVRVWRSGV
jgi:hypothetical protein